MIGIVIGEIEGIGIEILIGGIDTEIEEIETMIEGIEEIEILIGGIEGIITEEMMIGIGETMIETEGMMIGIEEMTIEIVETTEDKKEMVKEIKKKETM